MFESYIENEWKLYRIDMVFFKFRKHFYNIIFVLKKGSAVLTSLSLLAAFKRSVSGESILNTVPYDADFSVRFSHHILNQIIINLELINSVFLPRR